jgi:crotonobetainyl-CoA:carnitine CoA-transferase CaiB-like acyl-CoA transferase
VPEVFAAQEVIARGLVQTVAHPRAGTVKMVASPLRVEGVQRGPDAPPLLGQHTRAVLRDVLGRSEAEIATLEAAGVIVAAQGDRA